MSTIPDDLKQAAITAWNESSRMSIRRVGHPWEPIARAIMAEREAAAARITKLDDKIGQAYQAIGSLVGGLQPTEEEWQRALDYFSGDTYDEEFLPWPIVESEQPSSDLVKRLREEADFHSAEPSLETEAADRIEALETENARFLEALTPSGDTKAAYMGEFKFSDVVAHDNDGNPIYGHTYVPWTTIKEIMAAIRARAALTGKAVT